MKNVSTIPILWVIEHTTTKSCKFASRMNLFCQRCCRHLTLLLEILDLTVLSDPGGQEHENHDTGAGAGAGENKHDLGAGVEILDLTVLGPWGMGRSTKTMTLGGARADV